MWVCFFVSYLFVRILLLRYNYYINKGRGKFSVIIEFFYLLDYWLDWYYRVFFVNDKFNVGENIKE